MSMPLLMIPGPTEVSPGVRAAYGVRPPSHVSPAVIEAFGRSLERMRRVWVAGAQAQPFVIAGSGTIAMEMAVANVIDAGERVVLVDTGYFSARIGEMLRRRGAEVVAVEAPAGARPSLEEVADALDAGPTRALVATHVDTSTGVRVDAAGLAGLARERDVLSIFDGVCATAGEAFQMEAWGADVYLTASQKALGLPPGLALLVASPRALAARARLKTPPPLAIDFEAWLPIMEAYEARRPSYFSTPATNLVLALDVGLGELLGRECGELGGVEASVALHARAAEAMRAAWEALGLSLFCADADAAANTLSAVRYPEGAGPELLSRVAELGVIVAGGLYPGRQGDYFRVGHMGYSVTRDDQLLRTVDAIDAALAEALPSAERGAGLRAADAVLRR